MAHAQDWVVADPAPASGGVFADNASARDLGWGFGTRGARPNTHFGAHFAIRGTSGLDTESALRFETDVYAEFAPFESSWSLFAVAGFRVRDDFAPDASADLAGLVLGGKFVLSRARHDLLVVSGLLSGVLPVRTDIFGRLATARVEPGLAVHLGVPRRFGLNAELSVPVRVESPRSVGARGFFELYAHASDPIVIHIGVRWEFASGFSGDAGFQRHFVEWGMRTGSGFFVWAQHDFGPDAPFAFAATFGWAFFP